MKKFSLILSLLAIVFTGCGLYKSVQNISRLKYKTHSVTNFNLQGVDIKNKKTIKDFHPLEILKLTSAIAKENLLLTFTLNIEAKNPNDGTGGFPQTDISINSFPWRLFLSDIEIVHGNISKPVYVPGKGGSIIIPLEVQFDLAKSYKEKSMEDILSLILHLGGIDSSTSNLKLKAKPVLGTVVGNIEYPDEVTIIDKTFE